jgi:hypothetical protein
MKALKFILCLFVLFVSHNTFSYTLIINKTFLSHNPNGAESDYKFTRRDETIETNPMDPNIITKKTVDIFCEGNGTHVCPNQLAIPADVANPPAFMTVQAINAAQALFNTVVGNYESTGTMTGSSGTIGTPDGLFYNYVISWTSSVVSGDQVVMTFTSA